MLDTKWIKNNPEKLNQSLEKRGLYTSERIFHINIQEANKMLEEAQESKIDKFNSQTLVVIYEQKCLLQKQIDDLKHQLNKFEKVTEKSHEVKERLQNHQEKYKKYTKLLNILLSYVPNIIDEETPLTNTVIKDAQIEKSSCIPHYETNIGINTEDGVKISGKRFCLLERGAALLERALMNFMLDTHRKNGYAEISIPCIVKASSMYNTGQLPKFHDDAFALKEEKWLIPTAEVTLVNIVQNQFLSKKDLPLKFVTCSDCFRSEAGSAGSDTKGLIRVHQFKKVELIHIIDPQTAKESMKEILKSAENILQLLKLPCRIVSIGADDIGFTAARQFDLEVWMPGMQKFVEVSSCSLCYDFQSRRMNTKIKENKVYPYTLNGSGLAIGRTLAAIIENYQISAEKCLIPDVLHPYIQNAISSEEELHQLGLALTKS